MMRDVATIVWKEWQELFGERGWRGKMGTLLTLAVFGVALPLQSGRAWVESPAVLLAWSWVPMFLVSTVIADAFAGERERHTLETLLASRLSDRAILLGKMAAAIGYAAGVTVTCLLLGLVTVNIAVGVGRLVLYPLPVVAATLTIGLLGAVLVAAAGTLISLRAATVRHAVQMLGGTIMVLLYGPVVLIRMLPPAWKARLVGGPAAAAVLAIVVVCAVAVIDAGAVALVVARFRRSRLVAG